MVGIVIVSHSARLAEGVEELARGMAGPDVPMAATGGLDMPDRPLGTDANLVLGAIERVYSDDGVLVLMDLGSALLSAEMALEMLPPERRGHVVLCEAPLVEGAVAAGVQARLGASLEQVAAEARGALAAKVEQLGPAAPPPSSEAPPAAQEGSVRTLRLRVQNRLGLHARPAARFVQAASRFGEAEVRVRNLSTGRGPANGKSINAVTTLGVRQGHEIEVTAAGPEAEAALAAVQRLAEDNFGDAPEAEAPAAPTPAQRAPSRPAAEGSWPGLAAAPGIGLGPARHFRPARPVVPMQAAGEPEAEWEALTEARAKARAQIEATRAGVARRAGAYAAAIFEAHLLILDDEGLVLPARRAIFEQGRSAAAAWQQAVEAMAAEYRALDDEYQRARAADVEGVGQQVLLHLFGAAASGPDMTEPGILVAADLTPADTARLDPTRVQGLATAYGAPTSHSAILARTLGLPAVVGLGKALLSVAEGTPLIVDGDEGRLWVDPGPGVQAEYARRAEGARAAAAAARALSEKPAVTRDGRRVEVVANIGSPADARAAVAAGAEGVGLFRTEFLFLDRQTAPDEGEQAAAYRAAAEALGGRPLIIRTLDVGGDKPLPYLRTPPEANPFLGWRAIRLCLDQPELFKTQLRAILRVAAEASVKIMFPMIATLSEWRAARALLREARDELAGRGEARAAVIETGIMVEIPAAALRAREFAAEVDFFSIGTNDLTQYTLAAERGNPRLAALADGLQPAVLELIRQVVAAAHAQGKWVGVCGELAGDPAAVPVLVGLGVDELSMNAPAIPRSKALVRELDYAAARSLALEALRLETPEAVRRAVSSAKAGGPAATK